jgi:hypothetical protein
VVPPPSKRVFTEAIVTGGKLRLVGDDLRLQALAERTTAWSVAGRDRGAATATAGAKRSSPARAPPSK